MELVEQIARIIISSKGPKEAAEKIVALPDIEYGQEARKHCYVGNGPDGLTVRQRTR